MRVKYKNLKIAIMDRVDVPVIFSEVYVEKAKRTFICAHFKLDDYKMCLYDPKKESTAPVSRIDYHFNYQGLHISHFKTSAEYQNQGLGRKVYNLAMAHADSVGITYSHGYILPTGEIKAFSNKQAYSELERLNFLKDVYKNLDNVVIPLINDVFEYEFESTWKHNERVSMLPLEEKEFIHNCKELYNEMTDDDI